MIDSEQEKKFLELRTSGKSLITISKELGIPVETLLELDFEYSEELQDSKTLEYDRIIEEHNLASVNRFKYLAELYNRLKEELDKRDFSGLPTDKLYLMLTDVHERIQSQLHDSHENDIYDDEDLDRIYDLPDNPE